MTDPNEALRKSAALSEMQHVSVIRVFGDDAFDALDELVAADLHVRDGEMLHSLMLHPDGAPAADVYLCADDDEFILLVEGLSATELMTHARRLSSKDLHVEFSDLKANHDLLSLNGPFAWEVLSEWLGPDIIGIPYLTFFHLTERDLAPEAGGSQNIGTCFRAGKTGEFGYDLLLPADRVDLIRGRLLEVGESLNLVEADLSALDQCALENGFFSVRHGPLSGLTPLELQLQWRLSFRKEYVGSEALTERKVKGPQVRTTTFVAGAEVGKGDLVSCDGSPVGEVWTAGFSPVLKRWLGLALLKIEFAHPGITSFTVEHGGGEVPVRTVSSPVVNNRSLYIDPRRHSYRYRDELAFPPFSSDVIRV